MPYTPRPVPQTSLSPDSDVGKLSQYIDEEQRSIARAMQEVRANAIHRARFRARAPA